MKFGWIPLSFLAVLCTSLLITGVTYVTRKGVPLSVALFSVAAIVALSYGAQAVASQGFQNISWQMKLVLFVIGIITVVGNFAQFQSSALAPNPGLPTAIVSAQAAVVTLLAVFFLRDAITIPQIIGIGVTILGVLIVSLTGK